MSRKATVCLLTALALCTSFAMAEQYEVMFYDSNGTLLTNNPTLVRDVSGKMLQKLPPSPDGVYTINADRGQKLQFIIDNPALGNLNKQEFRMPLEIVGPIAIDLPNDDPSPQQAPANDNCEQALGPVAIGSVTSGTTIGATIEPFPQIPDCPTEGGVITAPGSWLSVVGDGNTLTASTCELSSPGSADYDTKITIYCKACDETTCVNSDDDEGNEDFSYCGLTFHSTVTWGSQAGVTYHILMHGFGASVGNYNTSIQTDGVPAVPTVDCLPPPITGGCCIADCADPVFGHCEQLTSADCATAAGTFLGDNSACTVPTGASSSYNSSPNAPISETLPPTVDTINVTGSFKVVNVTVDVILQHTFIGDLVIDVTSPGGKTSNLWENRCGGTDNMDQNFSDLGTDTLCASIAAPGGSSNPVVTGLGPALAQFAGDAAAGDWTITIEDLFGGDSGTLLFWQLNFEEGIQACAFCGDGVVGGTEECDDGNRIDGDGCQATCVLTPVADEDEDGDWWGFIENELTPGTGTGGVFTVGTHSGANHGGTGATPAPAQNEQQQRIGRRLPRR